MLPLLGYGFGPGWGIKVPRTAGHIQKKEEEELKVLRV